MPWPDAFYADITNRGYCRANTDENDGLRIPVIPPGWVLDAQAPDWFWNMGTKDDMMYPLRPGLAGFYGTDVGVSLAASFKAGILHHLVRHRFGPDAVVFVASGDTFKTGDEWIMKFAFITEPKNTPNSEPPNLSMLPSPNIVNIF